MSSILDALERASQERQPGKVDILPEIAPVPDEKKSITRILLLVALILILLALVFWLTVRDGTGEVEQASQTHRQTPRVTPSQATVAGLPQTEVMKAEQRDPLPVERIRSSTTPNQQPLVTEARLSERQQRMIRETPKPVVRPQVPLPTEQQQPEHRDEPGSSPRGVGRTPPALEAPDTDKLPPTGSSRQVATTTQVNEPQKVGVDPATQSGDLTGQQQIPLIWELNQGLREKLEQLKTTIHVYHKEPAQRFVIINMHRYSEGDLLGTTGFRLHEINREGIIVDYGDGLVRLLRE